MMIENLIQSNGELEIDTLAEHFGVSAMTIRRDLEALESQGVLRRVVGGRAIALEHKTHEPALVTRAMAASASKAHIGEAVASRLAPHEVVYFDGGSTALAVARAVRQLKLGLTVITRSLLVAMEFADEADTQMIYLLGGRLKSGEMLTMAATLDDDLAAYNVDTYVMGISGVHATRGLTDYDPHESAGKRVALQQSDRVILGFDRSKLDRVLLARVAGLSEIDVVITDADPDHPALVAIPPGVDIEFVDAGPAAFSATPALTVTEH
jgi:DeoR/GlpR family transcriptional regulator of sugar metabolism